MTFVCSILLVVGAVGAFDTFYFHGKMHRLTQRPDTRREAWIHVARAFVYTLQFALVPNVRFSGAWLIALLVLFALDATIAALDVLEEPRSRAAQGGLPAGEYAMHILLSVLIGAYLHALYAATPRFDDATSLTIDASVAWPLRALLGVFAVGSFANGVIEALTMLEAKLAAPRPIHVRMQLAEPLADVWRVTQDHVLHPRWDHRFTRIVMENEGAEIGTGTTMTYEKDLLGITIVGRGRYKLHKPMRQSTFEFWSDDPRSLIASGVGLWLYTPLGPRVTEFSTSYTYAVKFGVLGRLFDRLIFRPIFQAFTEASFRRLGRELFGVKAPRVLGREARKPARFDGGLRSDLRAGLA